MLWLTQWQPVGPDEPGYTDPAASLALGQGFTSGAWYAQRSDEFWAGNVPVHALLKAAWFKAFGFGVYQSRSFDILLVALGSLVLASILRRPPVALPAGWQAFGLAVWLLQESSLYLSHLGRPDSLCFLLTALAIRFWLVPAPGARRLGLFVTGALLAATGLQMIFAAAFAAVFFVASQRGRRLADAVSLLGGCAAGLALLLGVYYFNGVLDKFWLSVFPHAAGSRFQIYRIDGWIGNRSFWFLLLASAAMSGLYLLRKKGDLMLLSGAVYFTWIFPVLMWGVSKFSAVYTWMPMLGGVLFLLAAGARERAAGGGVKSPGFLVVAVCLTAAALVGLPRRALVAVQAPGLDLHQAAEQYVERHVKPGEHAVYATALFYPVRSRCAKAYYENWYLPMLTPEEKNHLSVLVSNEKRLEQIHQLLGDGWQPAAESFEALYPRTGRPALRERIVPLRRNP